MADRFPSIEDVEEGTTGDVGYLNDDANADDLLAREREALGEDAAQFAVAQDNIPSVSVQDGDDDLLGGGFDDRPNGTSQFQTSFPPVDTQNENVGLGGSITGGGFGATRAYSPTPSGNDWLPGEEPQVIKDWREQQEASIAQREETAIRRKEETIKSAQEAIDEFYENYNNKRDKGVAQTRKDAEEFLKNREDTAAGGTSWERIARLVEVKGAGKAQQSAIGKERFRELLLSLSKDENAPGAKGY